jgi:hypothetical protein
LIAATYANLLARDDQYVYVVNESAFLIRVPRSGGEPSLLAELENWLPLAMVVDDTTVYVSALPVEAIDTPMPGAILAVPKNGGVVSVLASGVATSFALAFDETHLYWAAAGVFNIQQGEVAAGGNVERIRKDGSGRQLLASNLSAPIGMAIDETNVYFGESGLATGDSSIGLERVAKSGGNVTILRNELAVVAVALDGNDLIATTAVETSGGIVVLDKAGTTPPRRIWSTDESTGPGLQVGGRRAYVMIEPDSYSELLSVSLDTPGNPVLVRGELEGDAFLLDGCAVIVNTSDGDVVRTPR